MPPDHVSVQDPPKNVVKSGASAGTRRFSWGIFEVVYDYPKRIFAPFNGPSDYSGLQYTLRFIRELCTIAPRPFAIHILGCLWMSVSPALSLYLSYSILNIIGTQTSVVTYCDAFVLQLYVALWLFLATASTLVDCVVEENKMMLSAHLRSHFLPKLANASLRLDVGILLDPRFHRVLPDSWGFGEGAPGLSFLTQITTRLRNLITLVLDMLVLVRITLLMRNPDATILGSLLALSFALIYCTPSNAIGGSGYIFYTKNKHFHRLHGLYKIIFDVKYRETLVKDGVHKYLSGEFKQTVDALGVTKTDPVALACYLPPPWYWMLSRILFIDYPMAVYALTLPWSLSSSSITTMVLFQHASTTVGKSIDGLKGNECYAPLGVIINQIRRFYETLEYEDNANRLVTDYPSYLSCSKGMRISFRNVSFTYGESADDTVWALRHIWFDIEPGQLVVIVGGNGSGKTSLLKLLPRLTIPTSGEVFIDDIPVQNYDVHQLRQSMAFLAQSEDIYPISLQENILMGHPDHLKNPSKKQIFVDEAARLGGSYDLITRLGYDRILNPPNVLGQSLGGCGNGEIGPFALEELGRHSSSFRETPISCGEKQRLLASRTFMRLKNSDARLLVVDEPASALDPIAERDLFNRFLELRKGRTTIFVTHRFWNVVKQADLILCIKAGQVVQRGRHDELVRHEKGEYAKLFRAQAE